jgi:hypothetical protein
MSVFFTGVDIFPASATFLAIKNYLAGWIIKRFRLIINKNHNNGTLSAITILACNQAFELYPCF